MWLARLDTCSQSEVTIRHVTPHQPITAHRDPGQPHQARHLQPRALAQQDDVLAVVVTSVRGVREVLQVATSQLR